MLEFSKMRSGSRGKFTNQFSGSALSMNSAADGTVSEFYDGRKRLIVVVVVRSFWKLVRMQDRRAH